MVLGQLAASAVARGRLPERSRIITVPPTNNEPAGFTPAPLPDFSTASPAADGYWDTIEDGDWTGGESPYHEDGDLVFLHEAGFSENGTYNPGRLIRTDTTPVLGPGMYCRYQIYLTDGTEPNRSAYFGHSSNRNKLCYHPRRRSGANGGNVQSSGQILLLGTGLGDMRLAFNPQNWATKSGITFEWDESTDGLHTNETAGITSSDVIVARGSSQTVEVLFYGGSSLGATDGYFVFWLNASEVMRYSGLQPFAANDDVVGWYGMSLTPLLGGNSLYTLPSGDNFELRFEDVYVSYGVPA